MLKRASAVAAGAALCAAGAAAPALFSSAASAEQTGCSAPSNAVSCTPAPGTPALATGDGLPIQQVRQIVQCGSTMYAVGDFTTLTYDGQIVHRDRAFSFSANPPYAITSWRPDVNGTVNSIAVGGGGCSRAWLGGDFTSVHGTGARNIAEVNTTDGAVETRFGHDANREVDTVALHGYHLLTGGEFTQINGQSHYYYVSLNRVTGQNDRYIDLHISGNYHFAPDNPTRVYNQQISSGGTRILAEGDFTSVGGQRREQIFMLNLGNSSATLSGWNSSQFYGSCQKVEPFYVRAASWAPSGSTVYIADTGFRPNGASTSGPRSGLCDAAAAFPSTATAVHSEWVNYTGCDSLYSTAAGSGIVYVGGHERWADNSDGCNRAGAGAIAAPGMSGLAQGNGALVFNPTRSRGIGADDELLTSAGLWVADDTFGGTMCGGETGHGGICFLPNQ